MLKAPTAVHKIDLRHSFTNFQVQKEKSPGVLNLSYSINKLLSSNNQNSGLGVRRKEEMSVNVFRTLNGCHKSNLPMNFPEQIHANL